MMPVMAGDELAATIRRTHQDMKVLYITGYSDRLFSERTVLWQDEAFIDKPISPAGLLEAVSLALFGHTLCLP
jgi:two-component system, cell cycle sensor histidine kinase and response regulator CckA